MAPGAQVMPEPFFSTCRRGAAGLVRTGRLRSFAEQRTGGL